jgi:hypothetical protein
MTDSICCQSEKINITVCWGLAARSSDQGIVVPLDVLSARFQNLILPWHQGLIHRDFR